MTLFQNKVFVDVIVKTRGREGHVKMKAKTAMLSRNAKNCWQPSEAGRGKEGFSSRTFRESTALPPPAFQICSFRNVRK